MRRASGRYAAAALLTICAGALSAPAAGSATSPAAIAGAGSTLVAPLEAEWATGFHSAAQVAVNYDSVDSVAGIDDLISHSVDFAATETPLGTSQASACSGCVELPWGLSAIAIGYHIGGLGPGLRLNAHLLGGIYLGQIKRWNAPAIRALNPRMKLPNLKIVPIYRNDGAGTTYALSDFLTHADATWASKAGTGASIPFSAGAGAQGDFGVVGLLKARNGAIAYVSAAYLAAQKQPVAAIENSAKKFVYPNLGNIQAAASGAQLGSNGTTSIVDPPASSRAAYPISTFTYVVASKSGAKAGAVKQFVQYALGHQSFGASIDFAALPDAVLSAARTAAASL